MKNEILNVNESNLPIFFFGCWALRSHLENYYLIWGNKDLHRFSSKSFIVLALIFRNMVHLIFVYVMKSCVWGGPTSFFYMWLSCYSRPICWKGYFSTLNYFGTLVENQLTINIRVYISILNAILLISMPIPHCLDYCNFVLKFWSQNAWVLLLCSYFLR